MWAGTTRKKERKTQKCGGWRDAPAGTASRRRRDEAGAALQGTGGGNDEVFDAVFGGREFSNDEIKDFVLLRSGKEEKNSDRQCTR